LKLKRLLLSSIVNGDPPESPIAVNPSPESEYDEIAYIKAYLRGVDNDPNCYEEYEVNEPPTNRGNKILESS
jgi:hypothetical protein